MGNSLKRNRFAIYDSPDVVHIQVGMPVIDQFLLKPLARRFPVVLTVHDVQPHSEHFSSKHSFLKRFFSIPHRLIVHFEGGKRQLVENWGVYADRIDVIPHGIIPMHNTLSLSDARKKLNLPLDREVVLLFGSIRANKGLSVLLRALEIVRLQYPRILLVVAGSVPRGVSFEPYSSIIERSNLSKHVRTFLWFIDDDDVDMFFAVANLIVLPYLKFESQSGVLLRAYTHKKPVVVSNVGAMGELVSVDNVGLVVEPGEPESLAMAIISVLHDPEKFKAHYTTDLESKYSWRHIAESTMRNYEVAIKDRNLG
jgi:glycosyltransferase involved in cell wall biosynthesis